MVFPPMAIEYTNDESMLTGLSLSRTGLAEYDEMEGISWKWQSIDGATVKAALVQETVGPNPTDRGKKEASQIC